MRWIPKTNVLTKANVEPSPTKELPMPEPTNRRDKIESGVRREREKWRIVLDEQTYTIQQGGYAMSKDTVMESLNREKGTRDNLTDLLREGAKRLIA